MSWVSQTNLKTIMTAIRNKFTTGDLVIANDAKDTGVELNHTAQDGLVTVSPISTNASVESALHLSNGDDTKKTELTQGTLSYVTGTGDSEAYNYMSLLGNGVTFGKKGGGNVQVGGVADPTSEQQVATKNYVDGKILMQTGSWVFASSEGVPSDGSTFVETTAKTFTFKVKSVDSIATALTKLRIECIPCSVTSGKISNFANLMAYAWTPSYSVNPDSNEVTVTLENFVVYNTYSDTVKYQGMLVRVWYFND